MCGRIITNSLAKPAMTLRCLSVVVCRGTRIEVSVGREPRPVPAANISHLRPSLLFLSRNHLSTRDQDFFYLTIIIIPTPITRCYEELLYIIAKETSPDKILSCLIHGPVCKLYPTSERLFILASLGVGVNNNCCSYEMGQFYLVAALCCIFVAYLFDAAKKRRQYQVYSPVVRSLQSNAN